MPRKPTADVDLSAMPAITLEQAKLLDYGDMLYSTTARNADGSACRVRVQGKAKTWKRTPDRVEVTAKYGLRGYIHIHADHLGGWSLTDGSYPL